LGDRVDPRDAARGQWHGILTGLGGISPSYLTGNHGPCPFCDGTDRWRWDDRDGTGSAYCNQCGGPEQAGGSLSGTEILMRAKGWPFKTAMDELRRRLGVEGGAPVRRLAVQNTSTSAKRPKPAKKPAAAKVLVEEPQQPIPVEEIDSEAVRFLQALGKGPSTTRIRGFYHGDDPRKGTDRGKKAAYSAATIAEWQADGRGIYFVVNHGGDKDADINGCVAFFCEFDDRSREEQIDFWKDLGLPEPTAQVSTGGRSVHSYWALDEWIGADEWKAVQIKLLDYVDADRTLKNPSRVMRLPGPRYAVGKDRLGEQCRVISCSGLTYRVDEIEGCLKEPESLEESPEPPTREETSDDGAPFEMVGFDKGQYYYYPRGTCQVMSMPQASHGATTNLLSLAGLGWWEDKFPKCNKDGEVIGVEWQRAIDWLFREQQRKGVFDVDKLRGLGAWWDNGRVVMHLGNRLVVQGERRPLWRGIDSDYIYEQSVKLEGPGGEQPLTDEEGARLLALCEGFNWEQSSAGMLLAGWVALAPVCGAMRWRPHLWLTAAAGAGKSTILERLVKVLLGDLVIAPGSNATEAGIRQALRSSALPIVFDEAESNDQHEAARMQAVLGLARFASSEGSAQILKGTATGEGTSYRVRTMFLLSSVATALKHGADKTRFSQLTLTKPSGMSETEIQERWRHVDGELRDLVTPTAGLRLIARSVALIPMLRDALEVFAKACAAHMGSTRLGDQYGALCAGAWSLEHQRVPTREEAVAWLEMYPLGDFAEQSEAADERDCWQTILEETIQVDLERVTKGAFEDETVVTGHVRRTILSLMHSARGTNADASDPVTPRVAMNVLGRHGIRVDGERVAVANNAKALKKLLKGTPWPECYPNMLKRVEGARASAKPIRFSGVGMARATELPFPLESANVAEPEPSP
jgi:hypothetical protein